MSEKNRAAKVGLFVFVGIVLIGALMLGEREERVRQRGRLWKRFIDERIDISSIVNKLLDPSFDPNAWQRTKALVEKPEHPASNLALVGLYYLTRGPALFDCLDTLMREGRLTRGEVQLTDALGLLIERGEELRPFPVEGWYDCGKTETLLETNRALLDQLAGTVTREGVVVLPPVAMDPTARVSAAVIGPHVTIGPRAQVRHAVVRNSIVNEGADVQDILLEGSVVGENAVVRGAYQRLNIGESSEVEYS